MRINLKKPKNKCVCKKINLLLIMHHCLTASAYTGTVATYNEKFSAYFAASVKFKSFQSEPSGK